MGEEELGDNIFMDVQSRSLIQRRNIEGAANLNTAHYDVGLATRLTIERLGGTMPENLPRARPIPKGKYLPQFAHEWESLSDAPPAEEAGEDVDTPLDEAPPDE